jgi:preprotein translocase subunit SecE
VTWAKAHPVWTTILIVLALVVLVSYIAAQTLEKG